MKHENTVTLIAILFIATAITFAVYYRPPQQLPFPVKTVTSTLRTGPPATTTTEKPRPISFTIVVNRTKTVPVTVSIAENEILYYAPSITFTLTDTVVIHSDATTTLPDVDAGMIIIGDLRAECTSTGETISVDEPFWPELFLEAMGYTTATLTGILPCENQYLVAAG